MTKKLYLRIIFDSLKTEPLLQTGTTNAKGMKSCRLKVRALIQQYIAQTKVLIDDQTSTDTVLTAETNDPITPPQTSNTLYQELHELLISLEEDAFILIDGDKIQEQKDAYKTSGHAFRVKLDEFAVSLGISVPRA